MTMTPCWDSWMHPPFGRVSMLMIIDAPACPPTAQLLRTAIEVNHGFESIIREAIPTALKGVDLDGRPKMDGKVRDMHRVDDRRVLVTTDRVSVDRAGHHPVQGAGSHSVEPMVVRADRRCRGQPRHQRARRKRDDYPRGSDLARRGDRTWLYHRLDLHIALDSLQQRRRETIRPRFARRSGQTRSCPRRSLHR